MVVFMVTKNGERRGRLPEGADACAIDQSSQVIDSICGAAFAIVVHRLALQIGAGPGRWRLGRAECVMMSTCCVLRVPEASR
jgi:hypothetical protein